MKYNFSANETGNSGDYGNRCAIYCRLSKDDELQGESASIQNQRDLLESFCYEHGWNIVGIYQDDGYTGLNMDRPEFQKMLTACQKGEIDIVVTKDLSRLGRNYLQTGQLIEEFFPKQKVRYIALNDGVDTEKDNNEITPFKNILNEFYSRDVSKKVHSSYLMKARKGKFTGCLAPFGYKKSPEDKNQLIVDPETAWIVKKIYQWAVEGHGSNYIRRRLEEEKIPAPAWWNRQKGLRNTITKWEKEDPENGKYVWDFTTIKEILSNPVYLGTIASQKTVYKFKMGWLGDKKPEDWIMVEHMHEPIIEEDTYALVQEKVKMRKRPDAWGNYGIFAGLVKCGECGNSMNSRATNAKNPVKVLTCSKYNKYGVAHCSQHRIEYETLYQIVLEQIRTYAVMALQDKDSVIKELESHCRDVDKAGKEAAFIRLEADKKRLEELNQLVNHLYDDRIAGRINDSNFDRMMGKAQQEQEMLQDRIHLSEERLQEETKAQQDRSKWLTLIQKYADITELDREMLHLLINSIIIHEDILENKHSLTVEIHFNFMEQCDKMAIDYVGKAKKNTKVHA